MFGKPDPSAIPQTMRALQLLLYDGHPESLSLIKKPVPRPRAGEVLVRVGVAPVNPSDLMFLRGLYGQKKKLPVVPGFEGSGDVLAAGGGLYARALVGRRVACAAPPDGDGTWAEYMTTPARLCIPLRKGVTLEQGAALIVNPLTAWALVEQAVDGGHRAFVQTAAASALGQMIVRLSARRKLALVNIVRRASQAELLRGMGAQHVLDSSTPDFDERLGELCRRLGVTIAFDAVAGEMTGRLLNALERGGRVVVYGALSEQPCATDPRPLIFDDKRVEGFWLSAWLQSQNPVSTILTTMKAQKLLATDLHTQAGARLPLEDAAQGLEQYVNRMTGGKVFFFPGLRPPEDLSC